MMKPAQAVRLFRIMSLRGALCMLLTNRADLHARSLRNSVLWNADANSLQGRLDRAACAGTIAFCRADCCNPMPPLLLT